MEVVLKISFGLTAVGVILIVIGRLYEDGIGTVQKIGGVLFAQGFFVFFIVFKNVKGETDRHRKILIYRLKKEYNQVLINNDVLSAVKSDSLINQILTMAETEAHHSHPIDSHSIQVFQDNDTLTFWVGKDSQSENEYWVFWPKYFSKSEVGRFISADLGVAK